MFLKIGRRSGRHGVGTRREGSIMSSKDGGAQTRLFSLARSWEKSSLPASPRHCPERAKGGRAIYL